MILEEMKAIAREVIANKSRSYVEAARILAEYVLSLESEIVVEKVNLPDREVKPNEETETDL